MPLLQPTARARRGSAPSRWLPDPDGRSNARPDRTRALERLQRHVCPHPAPRSPRVRRRALPRKPTPSAMRSRSTRTAGASASTIVFSPSLAAPSSTTPASAAASAAAGSSRSEGLRLAERPPGPPEGRPPEGRWRRRLWRRAGAGRSSSFGRLRVVLHPRPLDNRRKAPVQMFVPVVGVADRGIELGQIVALLAEHGRRSGEGQVRTVPASTLAPPSID